MTDLRTAAQQALEALEYTHMAGESLRISAAITALRAALEQPERAQAMRDAGYTRRPTLREMADPEQPEQEPVAIVSSVTEPGQHGVKVRWLGGFPQIAMKLYTHPPRREWRGLTEDELTAFGIIHSRYQEESLETGGWFDFARAIEAALKERNA